MGFLKKIVGVMRKVDPIVKYDPGINRALKQHGLGPAEPAGAPAGPAPMTARDRVMANLATKRQGRMTRPATPTRPQGMSNGGVVGRKEYKK